MVDESGQRFVVCGEALIDLVPDVAESSGTFSTGWRGLSAGSPMNTAVALAHLGADSHFLGRISSDEFGQQLRGHLEQAGVELDLAASSDLATSLAVVSLDDEGKASYTFHFDRTANFIWGEGELPVVGADSWFHTGSLALIVPPGRQSLLDWAATITAPMSIDLNVRPAVVADPDEYCRLLEPWLRRAGGRDVIKASDDDLDFLARGAVGSGLQPGDDGRCWRPLAERWASEYAIDLFVVTRGADGASARTGAGEWVEVPGFPIDLVDTVGAGDTFMAGFLDGYVRLGQELLDALCRGTAAAAVVCSRQGAQPPTAAEVEAFLAQHLA